MTQELGSQFVKAVSQADFETLQTLFSDQIVYTAASPGCAWKANGWPETEAALRELYPDEERISEIVSLEHFELPGRFRISYRLRGHDKTGPFEYEHQAYYTTRDSQISRLRVLCSGLYDPVG